MIKVALYKFLLAKGCGVSNSDMHRHLGTPVENHKSLNILMQRKQTPKTKVGSSFLFNQDVSYSCEEDVVRVVVHSNQPEEPNVGSYEVSRCAQLVHDMSKLHPDCVVKVWANNDHFCPFKGGGDIVIYKKSLAAACLTTNPEIEALPESFDSSRECTASPDPPTECLVPPPGPIPDATMDISPKKPGETRSGAIEAKCSHQQTVRAATLQLQANMLLLTSALLHSKIIAGEETIDVMTSYGVLMGHEYPLKVLKLSVCFEEGKICFEEQFSIAPCLLYSVYIDMAIDYIMDHL